MQKKTWTIVGSAMMLAVVAAGCGTEKVAPPPAPVVAATQTEKPGQVVDRAVVTAAARVVKVDQKTRVVTLKNAKGEVFDVEVGEEVRNLPQVKKGDDVVVRYYESLALTLKKPGEATPGVAVADAADRAKLGEKPGAAVGRQTTIVATVVGLDKKKGTVTLKGPKGKIVTVEARDPKRLEPVKVGDLIEAVYTEAVAISVEKPEAKPAKKKYARAGPAACQSQARGRSIPANVWIVGFQVGSTGVNFPKSDDTNVYVWCVRGGAGASAQ